MARPAGATSAVTTSLAKSKLGLFAVVFLVLAAAAPMTVINGGATAGFATTGSTGIPIAYVAVAIILSIFAIGYVAMARQIPNAGAFYTYVTHGLGPILGVGTAFIAVLAYFGMGVGLIGGLGYVASQTLALVSISGPWWAFALFGWALIGVFGLLRVEFNGRILGVLLIGEFVIALIFAGVQVAHPAGGHVSFEALSLTQLTAGATVGAMLVTAIAGFVGFENTAVFSEETRNPRKTIPIATFVALGLIGVAYAFCSWALTVATGPDRIVEMSTQHGSELTFVLAGPYVGTLLEVFARILFVTSLFAAAMSFHNTTARYLFALGREKVLPAAFGRASMRTKAPWVASVVQTGFAAVVIALYVGAGWDPYIQLFFWWTVAAGFGVLLLMLVTSIAVVAYFARQRYQAAQRATAERAGAKLASTDNDRVGRFRGLFAPAVAAVPLGWIAWETVVGFPGLLGVDPDSPLGWQFPAAFGVAAGLGLLRAIVLRVRRRDVYDGIGYGGLARRLRVAPVGVATAAGVA